ncbi:Formylmethionine deformylase-like protein [Daldinia childiae]|uniref:Formylmethionine deformylase-like protein n=1 Tax=Daldinia childiae TaxID=326645 RepID=UPI0014450E62|nr:Formylmethionine deformylase-like protein [Daldinia childiae]KAF3065783.1 Formylmethionine deformylase-like protein [Daldinia childiae]
MNSKGEYSYNHLQPSKDAVGNGVQVQTRLLDSSELQNTTDIRLQDPLLAIACFVGGILAAVGHHLYYQRLNDTPVTSENLQVWSIRIGTGLALLTRCGLVAAIGIAVVQQTWLSLRKRAMSIGGIDSMFDIMGNPWSFFNTDFLIHAKRLAVLAAIAWLLPIITIVTPATLSVVSRMTHDTVATRVPYYNFSNTDGWGTYGGFGYISGAAPEMARLFTRTYISNSPIPQTPPFANASYDFNFWAPSYKCSNASDIIRTRNNRTWDLDYYNYTNFEEAFNAEIANPISASSTTNSSSISPPLIYKSTAPSRMNNMILIGANGHNELRGNIDHNYLVCQLYNTSYDITMRFDNGVQSIHEKSIAHVNSQEWDNERGRLSVVLANGLCAPDPAANNATICPTYYMVHYLFTRFLTGLARINAGGELIFQSDGFEGNIVEAGEAPFFQSGLRDCPEIWNSTDYQSASGGPLAFQSLNRCPGGTLGTAIESLSRNFTYSLLTYSNWRNFTTEVPITVSMPKNFFYYNSVTLLITYSSAVVVTLLCICVGFAALLSNGYTSSTAFSAVLLTTRNPDLDRLSTDNTLGAKPLPHPIRDTKLRFGILRTEGSEPQAGFGLDGTVTPLENMASVILRKKGAERTVD